jgi:hypothetical protein
LQLLVVALNWLSIPVAADFVSANQHTFSVNPEVWY